MKDDVLKSIAKKRNSIEFEVYAKYAMFSDPVTRVGGEKFSYQIPTYQAIKGVLESIYWKPTFIWIIDAIRVVNKIQTEGKGIRPLRMGGRNELAFYAYLKKLKYQVIAHFKWNENRPNLKYDRNEHKHHNVAKRSVNKGGRRDIYLGTRECQGYVEPCDFGSGVGFYDNYGELDFGFMLHGIDYPDENSPAIDSSAGSGDLNVRFWNYIMKDGIIIFPPLDHTSIKRRTVYKDQPIKDFSIGHNLSSVQD